MNFKGKIIESTGWYLIVRLWTQGISWIVTLVLARLLSPEDYGLFGMAMAVIVCFELFQELGLGAAIIQRQNLSIPQINAVFWVVGGIGLLLFASSFVMSPLAAWYFEEPRLVDMIRVLGLVLLFNFLGMVPYSLLTKELDLKRRSLAEAFAVTMGVIVSITTAYNGLGFWALVYGQIVKAILKNLGLWFASGWMPSVHVSFEGFNQLMGFGFRVFGASGVKSLSNSANIMIVGKFLGGQELGFFTMADALGNNPLHKLTTSVINQISFPVFSKLQNDEANLRQYFLKITQYLALIGLPLQVGMALVAHDMVVVLLSEKWVPMVGLLQVFCIGWTFSILQLPASPLLTSIGQVGFLLKFSSVSAVILGVGFLVGVQFGLFGVGVAWLLFFSTTRLFILGKTLSILGISLGQYVETLRSAVIGILIMIAILLSVRYFLPIQYVIGRLLGEVAIGVACYIFVVNYFDKKIGDEVKNFIREFLRSMGLFTDKKVSRSDISRIF